MDEHAGGEAELVRLGGVGRPCRHVRRRARARGTRPRSTARPSRGRSTRADAPRANRPIEPASTAALHTDVRRSPSGVVSRPPTGEARLNDSGRSSRMLGGDRQRVAENVVEQDGRDDERAHVRDVRRRSSRRAGPAKFGPAEVRRAARAGSGAAALRDDEPHDPDRAQREHASVAGCAKLVSLADAHAEHQPERRRAERGAPGDVDGHAGAAVVARHDEDGEQQADQPRSRRRCRTPRASRRRRSSGPPSTRPMAGRARGDEVEHAERSVGRSARVKLSRMIAVPFGMLAAAPMPAMARRAR